MKKDLRYYRTLPYQKSVERIDEDGERYFVARIEELDGCIAAADSRPGALAMLKGVFDEYIEAMLEWGHDIAEPEQGLAKARGGMFKFAARGTIESGLSEQTTVKDVDPKSSGYAHR